MKACPNCGAENRDAARFCRVCGQAILQTAQPASLPTVASTPPQAPSHTPALTVLGAPPPPGGTAGGSFSGSTVVPAASHKNKFALFGPKAKGQVKIVDPGYESRLPFDFSRLLVILSFTLFILGILIVSAIFALTIFIILIVFGLGSICLLPLILPLFGLAIYPVLRILRGPQTARLVDFQVEDELSGQPVSSIVYLKENSSTIRLGDRVSVYGSRNWGTKVIHAHKIVVSETGGRATNYTVRGIRPWPVWVGLLSLAAVIGYYLWVLHLLHIW